MDSVTPKQAARALGVSADTIVNWFDRGLLSGHRLPTGGRRIDPASVKAITADMAAGAMTSRSLTPAAWLRREIETGRLATEPPAELLALAAELVRASGVTQPSTAADAVVAT
jgi:excisionase family DNA binding protein